ncbi:MAG TPA: glycosyltransferase family 39 protein [Solirubrobacteraceae bacterium]|jgi:mannosyltransferase|nr:glycosyltransferase family 39 protein [Solirubrobacteraceae bacterium]
MSAAGQVQIAPVATASSARTGLPRWWPLAALTLLAAALRLSTLDLQSFWYDEAFTPVHVLHPSLWATLRSVVHTENTPPLWYVLAWADSRVLGTGEVALRLPSALAGIATVPVAWAIGAQLEGSPGKRTRRAALVCAALVAVNPLFVWYSQEARAYGLFVLTAALAMLCFLRAEREPTPRRMAAFALTGSLALLTHYFAVFLLIPMALWLAYDRHGRRVRRAALPAIGALGVVGLALLPLISAQGGHGTQWIGRWPLTERLEAIPQYFLTGYSGAPLGHGVELLVALPILAGLALGLWRMTGPSRERSPGDDAGQVDGDRRRGVPIALSIAACGVLIPIVLVGFGVDYLAPRNLVAAMIPVTAVIALVTMWPGTGPTGIALAATIAIAFLAISLDVDLSPRLQRGNWRDVAKALRGPARERVITTVELGSTPLEYYLPGLHELREGSSVLVSEIDETGYAPLRASAEEPPVPGFRLLARLDVDGLIVLRFVSPVPRLVSEATLRRHVITLASPYVLVPAGSSVSS